MKKAYKYIRAGSVRKLVKECGKRCSHHMLVHLDAFIEHKVKCAAMLHNGDNNTVELKHLVAVDVNHLKFRSE